MSPPDQRDVDPFRGVLSRRQLFRGTAAVTAGGALAACSSSAPSTPRAAPVPKPRRGGSLVIGLTGGSTADTLDPHRGITLLDTARFQSLYQPLVQLDAQANIEYVLAESIKFSGDTTKWVIKLRPGVTFHDGKPLTANDVIYTFKRIVNNHLAGSSALGPVDLKNLKADGQDTVIVPMTQPYGTFLEQLTFWYYIYVVPEGLNPAKPNGTGPFTFKSFTPGQRSVFTRNPNYWKPELPYADQITFIDFQDNVSLQNALILNQIQAAGSLEGPQIASLSSQAHIKTVVSQTGSFTPFTMRVDKAPFNDVRVRQAMRLLVDRQQLIDSALDGFGTVAADVFSPYDPDFKHFTRQVDVPQAKSLLKRAGQENMTVQLVTSALTSGTIAMATVFAQQAKAGGVTIKLKNVPSGTFFGTNYLNWPFAQDYYGYVPYLAQVATSMLHASPFNETHFNDPHYASLYNQANSTASPSVRTAIIHQMQQIDYQDGAYIIPAFTDFLDGYSTTIAGYQKSRTGQPLSNIDFEHLYFV